MRTLAGIALFGLVMLPLPALLASQVWLNFLVMTLFFALLGIAWNVVGGYGGQFSFGHAAFFGTGAYCAAVLQAQLGLAAWLGFALAPVAGGAVAGVVGFLSFRYGLRGSYFALVTLAFAEVLRILANSAGFTGGGSGLLIKLAPGAANLQFADRSGFYYLVLALVIAGLLLSLWIERSRFGSYLVAVRENEDAARALGVDAFAIKLRAIVLSGAIAGVAGAVYAQMFLYVDPGLAFGPTMSVEALLVPIVGGMGTVFGPVLGSLALHLLSEAGRSVLGQAPGLNLALYGVLLVIMVLFLPDGLVGLLRRVRRRFLRGRADA
ncbi:MAG: branched-chain amino acid ABC transporter permease [Alphaproteobacteria bacterium]|nr:branched-chain amino acid ABC transporter permease [Alphaproteobacteria bacterium]